MRRHWAAVAAGLLVAGASHAAVTPGISFTGGNVGDTNGPFTLGYSFTADAAIRVTGLGAFDLGGDGLLNSRTVGLWTAGGTLLASATVTSADALVGQFRYAGIAGVQLVAGQTYVVGAADFGGVGQDAYWLDAAVTDAADVTYLASRFDFGPGLLFPSNAQAPGGYFGGNFLYDTAPSGVPEPSTAALIGVALAWLGGSRRRRAG